MKYWLISCIFFFLIAGNVYGAREIHERGWVGGEYQEIHSLEDYSLPQEIKRDFHKLILLKNISFKTPLFKAGLRRGDLILEVGGKKITDLSYYREVIDNSLPGKSVTVKVFRDGKSLDYVVKVGKESYHNVGSLSLGFRISEKIPLDLIPNPDFSLFDLIRYESDEERFELDGMPEKLLKDSYQSQEKAYGKGEGWNFHFLIFGVGKKKIILSQEIL